MNENIKFKIGDRVKIKVHCFDVPETEKYVKGVVIDIKKSDVIVQFDEDVISQGVFNQELILDDDGKE